jgi:hypothetical protein
MKERPILFSGEMVRAILDGRKTQTRRLVTPQPRVTGEDAKALPAAWAAGFVDVACPYGVPGDRLWVKETFIRQEAEYEVMVSSTVPIVPAFTTYRADADPHGQQKGAGWKSGRFMPRHLSRLTIEVTDVRVERLQDISEEDATAEGVTPDADCIKNRCARPHRDRFLDLWDELNAKRAPWRSNPWVWVVSFRRLLDAQATAQSGAQSAATANLTPENKAL